MNLLSWLRGSWTTGAWAKGAWQEQAGKNSQDKAGSGDSTYWRSPIKKRGEKRKDAARDLPPAGPLPIKAGPAQDERLDAFLDELVRPAKGAAKHLAQEARQLPADAALDPADAVRETHRLAAAKTAKAEEARQQRLRAIARDDEELLLLLFLV